MSRTNAAYPALVIASLALPPVAAAAPVTYRAEGTLTYVEVSSTQSTFTFGGSYILDFTFDTVPDAVPAPTATESAYTLTAVSFNYNNGAYVGGTSAAFVGTMSAQNNNSFSGDQVFFKNGTASGFPDVEGRTFSDDQRVLELSDKLAGSWSDASALPTLTLDMFDDYPLGDEAVMAMVWGDDDLLIINGNVTAFGLVPVPVPAAAWLLGSGFLALAGIRRRDADPALRQRAEPEHPLPPAGAGPVNARGR